MSKVEPAAGGRTRTIAAVTGSRADYGLLRPVLLEIARAADLRLRLMVCGAHLSSNYGFTVQRIEQDGFPIADRIETLANADSPEAIAMSIARGVSGFAQAFARSRPDLLVLLGDRYETISAGLAALPFAMPIAHIHGGELSEGAIDDAVRHALTKMSHLHFVSAAPHRARVIQMGEQPDRVVISGAPGLDTICSTEPTPRSELERRLELAFDPSPLLVTFHPVTLEYNETASQLEALMLALASVGRPIVFTYPNADTRASSIVAGIEAFAANHSNARVVKDLGPADYFGMMAASAAMVGNSSSGLIEAPSFNLPVVNIGNRQRGRLRAANVIDCNPTADSIRAAIARATASEFRLALGALVNPYGDGRAAARIVKVLRTVPLNGELVKKTFFDLPSLSEILAPLQVTA
jgi:UDP-hydrolysing UDP-N-acetyl-D-glucosamine 2-epimerase